MHVLNKALRKKLSYLYVILALSMGVFIHYSLGLEPIQVIEKEHSKKTEEVKPVKVTLQLENGTFYTKRMENTDSVLDFMESLRDEANFSFEKTAYTYGIKIEHINSVYPKEGECWAVFLAGDDITLQIGDVYLADGLVYDLKLIRN